MWWWRRRPPSASRTKPARLLFQPSPIFGVKSPTSNGGDGCRLGGGFTRFREEFCLILILNRNNETESETLTEARFQCGCDWNKVNQSKSPLSRLLNPPTPPPIPIMRRLIPAGDFPAAASTPASLKMQRYARNRFERWQAARFTLMPLKTCSGGVARRGSTRARLAFAFITGVWRSAVTDRSILPPTRELAPKL